MREQTVSRVRKVGSTIALAAISAMALVAPAGAQSSQVQLAFGYDCGDRFQVRNDGASTVDVEYGVAGAERLRARINPRESVAITSQSNSAMELWVNGRRVSTEQKGNRACSQDVVVRPLNSGDYSDGSANVNAGNGGGDNVTYTVQPTSTVYVTAPAYGSAYYPYYDPYYYGYGYGGYGYGYGYYGYRAPSLSVVIPFGSSRYYGGGSVYGRGTSIRGGSVGHSTGRTGVRR